MNRPQKVVAYVVRDERLLVFTHANDERIEQSGIQVPAGTVRDGELPEHAVLREASEETGLEGLRIERYLGCGEYDMRPYADAVHVRHHYHLSINVPQVPERWSEHERGDGDGEPIPLELYWIPLRQAHVIAAGQAAFLGRIYD